ncbi:hypothetical protein BJY24_007783 [Nocardia transvalensis]|uniref:Uncharacterized protein n=1 Tax=Nocardia transvalensis TaxID=37333 RepID=A0A7W9UMQ7_9NOCA|nr:hypothetical protein [Nocardia transvalensis]MBB5918871.1 hypothetical protein [Nocardia transvalensis]
MITGASLSSRCAVPPRTRPRTSEERRGVLPALRERLDELDRRATELDAARDLLRRTITATEAAAPGRDGHG